MAKCLCVRVSEVCASKGMRMGRESSPTVGIWVGLQRRAHGRVAVGGVRSRGGNRGASHWAGAAAVLVCGLQGGVTGLVCNPPAAVMLGTDWRCMCDVRRGDRV